VKTDDNVIGGTVRAVAASAVGSARGMRKLQTGYVRNYALLILLGALAALIAVLVVTL
jgi:NADH-quinone oxidoreductase subunit L